MNSLLVANRGEIAVRVIRAAKELGIRSIAVYSELDRDALHVDLADDSWNIGPAPAAESYLSGDRIIKTALEAGADAIHPGYGFLAENAEFARAVIEAGLVWVGPPADAIATMGDKIASRRAAEKAGVKSVPGTLEPLPSATEAADMAEKFGYPVAVKAAHGGGGKGLRVAHRPNDLVAAFEGAGREAEAYFGSSELYMERYLERPRHIEAQIVLDDHGNGVFLGERDCTVQRRHQKLIEETPSVTIEESTRKAIGEAALAVARHCGYVNAGTVEFLVDQEGEFFFLEMNTRLQVEHAITEMVTGIDLVKEQIRVAAGEPLSFDTIQPWGHAIEFRINAEDPRANFTPGPGRVSEYREPGGFGVRVDSWIQPGTRVSQYYDNLMAKLVVWGRDRSEAIERGRRALREFVVSGVPTTIPAHLTVLDHPDFIGGNHHTRWIEEEVDLSGIETAVPPVLPEEEALARRDLTVEVGGRRFTVSYWAPESALSVSGARTAPRRRAPKLSRSPAPVGGEPGMIPAPMQGTIVKVHVKAGDRISAGDPVCVLEAMKMENEVTSPVEGEVVDLRIRPGDTVATGAVLAIVR
jgi:acetyl-CoA/propionyl-CoA carboxylase biotin carboxyl carrier protein